MELTKKSRTLTEKIDSIMEDVVSQLERVFEYAVEKEIDPCNTFYGRVETEKIPQECKDHFYASGLCQIINEWHDLRIKQRDGAQ